jgi:hypothetical protein
MTDSCLTSYSFLARSSSTQYQSKIFHAEAKEPLCFASTVHYHTNTGTGTYVVITVDSRRLVCFTGCRGDTTHETLSSTVVHGLKLLTPIFLLLYEICVVDRYELGSYYFRGIDLYEPYDVGARMKNLWFVVVLLAFQCLPVAISLSTPGVSSLPLASATPPLLVHDNDNDNDNDSNSNSNNSSKMAASTFLFTSESVNEGHPGESSQVKSSEVK